MRAKSIKFLEEMQRRNICEFGLGKAFLEMTPKAKMTKDKIDQ